MLCGVSEWPDLQSLTPDRLRQQKSAHYSICVTQSEGLSWQKIPPPAVHSQGELGLRRKEKEH